MQKIIEHSYTIDRIAESLTLAGFDDISVSSFNSNEPVENTSRWFFVAG